MIHWALEFNERKDHLFALQCNSSRYCNFCKVFVNRNQGVQKLDQLYICIKCLDIAQLVTDRGKWAFLEYTL